MAAKEKSSTEKRPKPPAKSKRSSAGKSSGSTAGRVKHKAMELASNPLVAEVVAATLVAAAAALRDPKKARQLAGAAVDEVGTAGRQLAEKGSALWQLAQDVAKHSVEAVSDVNGDKPGVKKKKKDAPKKKKKKKK